VFDRANLPFFERRIAPALVLTALGGCVYPADDPTGLELSWRFFEANDADGEDGRRVRTCSGMRVTIIEVEIEDLDAPRRRARFDFDCTEGYQTQAQFQTRASDAFVPLHSGDYGVSLRARSADSTQLLATREIDVLDRGLTVELFELVPEPVTWELLLDGLETCDEFSIGLLHADPVASLAHPPRNEDGEVEPTLYRASLTTDRGLALSAETTACSDELAGEHVVEAMDRGIYRLEVTVDGRRCAFEIPVDGDARTMIDLDRLPCDG
jgi:hypothetical protein